MSSASSERLPRILHITNAGGFGRLQRGGGERAVEELSTAFSETEGWTAGVLAPPEFLTAAHLGAAVERLPIALQEFSLRSALTRRSLLRSAICAYQPTVVLTHLLRGTLVGVPAARLGSSAAVVSNLHNSLRDSVRFGEGGAAAVANVAAFRTIGRLANTHVAISPSNEHDLIRYDRMPRSKVVLIPNWVSPAFTELDLESVKTPLSGSPATLLIVGRLEAQKRQDLAIRLLPATAGVRLVLVGEGSLRAEYERLASELGVTDRVNFLGQRADIPELMAGADLVLVPSAFEGFGRVAVEALSVGTPVVAANVAGLVDVLGPAPRGAATLLDGADTAGWTRAIQAHLASPPDAAAIAAMRDYAFREYSLAASVDRYRRVVLQLSNDR